MNGQVSVTTVALVAGILAWVGVLGGLGTGIMLLACLQAACNIHAMNLEAKKEENKIRLQEAKALSKAIEGPR